MINNKEILAIDIDDVLAANAAGFVKFSNERWGTNLTVHDYDEHWGKMWDVDESQIEVRSNELHAAGVIGRYDVIQDAYEVLRVLSHRFRIVCVTSRRRLVEMETREWLHAYLPEIIDDIIFAGIYDDLSDMKKVLTMTKGDVLLESRPKYFIDDQLKHCYAAADVGIETILFGDYSWNQADTLPPGVVRCSTWRGVANYFGI